MSLGVLNNISALYAENNLNNTQNALQNTLQQLSSGTTLNSGADNPAGLSLADGLSANSAALTQSATNASDGVGLLQVADGALSQVNSLLNSAVTLATEASNGTLNSTQDAAANQEYQSILSEINNIGSSTTYNSTAVFGNSTGPVTTQIYTGDSSTAGASVDSLTFSQLSSSSVGTADGSITLTGAMAAAAASGGYAAVPATATPTASTTSAGAIATYTLATAADTISGVFSFAAPGANGGSAVTGTFSAGTTGAEAAAQLNEAFNGNGMTASYSSNALTITGPITGTAGQNITTTGTTLTDTTGTAAHGALAATISETGVNGGENLSATNLTSSSDAMTALTDLNTAISDVASQRGYLGSQINTLNSVASVETTEEENLTSAENSISATNYGQATTAMSQDQVLTQTGISALAQANSSQNDILKLLQ
jgi:flagellin